jgi:glutamate 5-kinase
MKRVVVKVGSHVLGDGNDLAFDRIKNLVAFLADLSIDHDVILVSSGAIIAGYSKLDIDGSVVANRQAIAAVGQPYLMSIYEQELNSYDLCSAQILLSISDFDSRKSTAHAKSVVDTLITNNVIPIINENDTTDIDELMYGDNDQLAAHVAHDFDADLLIMLSDLDGYYDKDQKKFSDAKMFKEVNEIDEKELVTHNTLRQIFDRGGIITKLRAAKFLLDRDQEMFMASGFELDDARSFVLEGIQKGGTYFRCKK